MKHIIVIVNSGMCNRLLPIISGMRLAERYGCKLSVCWLQRVGRACMPHLGGSLGFADIFEEPVLDLDMDPRRA